MSVPYPSPGRARYALVVLTLLGFVLTTDMMLTALLMEPMKRDMALSDVQVALLQGTAYGLALGLASLPMGRLIDRMSRRMLLAVGIVGWTGALIAIGTAGSPATVMVARVALGVVAALVVPAAFSIGADLYPPERRSMATSLLVVGQALGQGFGIYAGGKAFDALTTAGAIPFGLAPWRTLYLIAALLGLVVLAFLAGMREPARQERRDATGDFNSAARELWQYRGFMVPLVLGLVFIQITIQAASIWVSPLLIRRGLTPGDFSGWLGLVLILSGVLGALAGGRLAEAGRRRGGRRGVLLPAAFVCVVIAPASLFPTMDSVTAFAVLFALNIFAGAVVATIGVIAVTLAIPNEIRGLALGVNTFAAAVFGAAGAPAGVAVLSHILGGEAMLAFAFASICIPCALLAGLLLIVASLRNTRAGPEEFAHME